MINCQAVASSQRCNHTECQQALGTHQAQGARAGGRLRRVVGGGGRARAWGLGAGGGGCRGLGAGCDDGRGLGAGDDDGRGLGAGCNGCWRLGARGGGVLRRCGLHGGCVWRRWFGRLAYREYWTARVKKCCHRGLLLCQKLQLIISDGGSKDVTSMGSLAAAM